MTTGSFNQAFWAPISTSCSLSDKWGHRRQKNWSGGDRPKARDPYVILTDPDTGTKRRYRVRSGLRAPNNYSMTSSQLWRGIIYAWRPNNAMSCANGFYTWTQATNCYFDTYSYGVDPFTANDQLALLAKLHRKVWGSDFNLGVFLAEGNKSLEMIASAATRLTRSIQHAKAGNYGAAWKILGAPVKRVPPSTRKSMANIWAEYTWGWVPLFADMYSGGEWLAHMLHAPRTFRLAVRREKRNELGDSYKASPYSVGPHAGTAFWSHKRQLIAYLTEPPHNAVYNALDPASIAWELVPYSFVVDWSIPISTYLQVRGLSGTLQGTFVQTDLSNKASFDMVVDNPNPNAVYKCKWKLMGEMGRNYSSNFSMNRTVSTSLDIPKPVFKGFEKAATWKHAVDALALLQQKLRG